MFLRFKTTVNRNGWARYLVIDTENKRYSKQPYSIFETYIVINSKAIKELAAGLEDAGFVETFEYL